MYVAGYTTCLFPKAEYTQFADCAYRGFRVIRGGLSLFAVRTHYLAAWMGEFDPSCLAIHGTLKRTGLAGGEGFEPPNPEGPPVFRTGAISHSANHPS